MNIKEWQEVHDICAQAIAEGQRFMIVSPGRSGTWRFDFGYQSEIMPRVSIEAETLIEAVRKAVEKIR